MSGERLRKLLENARDLPESAKEATETLQKLLESLRDLRECPGEVEEKARPLKAERRRC